MNWKTVSTPLSDEVIRGLKAGDMILLNGTLYTARDRAHQRLAELLSSGEKLPVELKGECIYYVGPAPPPPGSVIGSAGPTTSYRMDPFTEMILNLGVKGLIGKGKRGMETRGLLKEFGALYFSSIGGAGAYLSKRIIKSEVIAFEDLGPEAIYKLEVKNFPVIVINDIHGGDLYEDAISNR